MEELIKELKFDDRGLIPVIAQDYKTDQVLMMAYMNEESFRKTIETGKAHYYSRSRQKLWLKGETSGHFQFVKSLSIDCDSDTLLIKVEQVKAACHTGHFSCFHRKLEAESLKTVSQPVFDAAEVYAKPEAENKDEAVGAEVLQDVYNVIEGRKINPKEGSYTNYLFDKGLDKILKKVGEEASEIIIAAKNQSNNDITYEISDLLYHLFVLAVDRGIKLEDIYKELGGRR